MLDLAATSWKLAIACMHNYRSGDDGVINRGSSVSCGGETNLDGPFAPAMNRRTASCASDTGVEIGDGEAGFIILRNSILNRCVGRNSKAQNYTSPPSSAPENRGSGNVRKRKKITGAQILGRIERPGPVTFRPAKVQFQPRQTLTL